MFTIKALIAIVIAVAGIAVSGLQRSAADVTHVAPQAQNYPVVSIGSALQAMRH